MFELRSVTKSFLLHNRTRLLFKNVSFTAGAGKRYAITGASGVGKSTLLLLLCGIEEPTVGSVFFADKPLPRFGTSQHEKFLCQAVGLMFQYPCLVPELTVLENVMLKGLAVRMSHNECELRGRELLEQVGLLGMAERSPSFLSGGEQQRVSLARALFLRPRFLIADEPSAHLDTENARHIFELIGTYQRDGMGVIMSSHDRLVLDSADEIFSLRDEQLVRW